MNNFFVIFIAILLVLSGSLFFFYLRDVSNDEDLLSDCTPMNLNITEVKSKSFLVEWETFRDCLGMVKYGDSVDSINRVVVDSENNIATKSHSIEVVDLKPSSLYYVVVFSDSVEYGIEGAPVVVNTKAF